MKNVNLKVVPLSALIWGGLNSDFVWLLHTCTRSCLCIFSDFHVYSKEIADMFPACAKTLNFSPFFHTVEARCLKICIHITSVELHQFGLSWSYFMVTAALETWIPILLQFLSDSVDTLYFTTWRKTVMHMVTNYDLQFTRRKKKKKGNNLWEVISMFLEQAGLFLHTV